MPFSAPRAVVSGTPYRIVRVADREPFALDDFIGETTFVLDLDGGPYTVYGAGTTAPIGVRFHEKDAEGSGKDIRVWAIHRHPSEPAFIAEHVTPSEPPAVCPA